LREKKHWQKKRIAAIQTIQIGAMIEAGAAFCEGPHIPAQCEDDSITSSLVDREVQ
jgi:hypothetical protein